VLSYPFILAHQIPLIRKMATRKTVSDVSADLREHEAKCEERWKTIFAETDEIKKEINDLRGTIRTATFGSLGFLSTLLIALLSGILKI